MKITVKRSLKPQATRLTSVLLAVVMISFGIIAEHHSRSPEPLVMHAQIMTNTANTQSGR